MSDQLDSSSVNHSSRPARWLALGALVPTALLLAFFYFSGVLFYEQSMLAWGFEPSLFPLSTQQVYIQAFYGWATIAIVALERLARVALYIALVFFPLFFLEMVPFGSLWRRWRATRVGRIVLAPVISMRERTWVNVLALATMGAMAMLALGVASVLGLNELMSRAARHNAQLAWARQTTAHWPEVVFTDDTGQTVTARLKTCSEKWCAIVDGNRARIIAADKVRAIGQSIPLASDG